MLKTFVMMIGEYDFEGIFTEHHDRERNKTENAWEARNNPFPVYSGLVFIVFVFMMTIIIMNMLVGLAVDDIVEIQNNAQFSKLSLNVGFLSLSITSKSRISHHYLLDKIGAGVGKISTTSEACFEHCLPERIHKRLPNSPQVRSFPIPMLSILKCQE